MNKIYLGFILAKKDGESWFEERICVADSEEAAVGNFFLEAKAIYPEDDGWGCWDVGAEDVTETCRMALNDGNTIIEAAKKIWERESKAHAEAGERRDWDSATETSARLSILRELFGFED